MLTNKRHETVRKRNELINTRRETVNKRHVLTNKRRETVNKRHELTNTRREMVSKHYELINKRLKMVKFSQLDAELGRIFNIFARNDILRPAPNVNRRSRQSQGLSGCRIGGRCSNFGLIGFRFLAF